MQIEIYDAFNRLSTLQIDELVDFLHTHLEEYGDPKSAIRKAIEYSAKDRPGHGGFVILAIENGSIIGAVVINKTGMEEYIPENILVYIAIDKDHRGKGLGKKLMKSCIENAQGGIALHVERDNPAIHLYEKMGFTSPYLEMRYKPT
jgi:GNAT superfamily N-acetyltransferase